jgi:glutamate dehydrogenase (NAD(P)+)
MVPKITRNDFIQKLNHYDSQFNKLQPELELTIRDPEMEIEGYVVVHSTLAARGGPLGRVGKGGTRITPTVSLDEVKMLARTMTLKNAGAGLSLGGAKSGMRGNPDEPDFEKKYRRFVSLVKPVLAENGGVFGGFGFDIGGRPIHPIWACDELGTRRSFTGKPLDMGGTDYDREGIAGLGVATAAKTLVDLMNLPLAKVSFAVQGLGAMGGAVIRYFTEYGANLKYISDPRISGTYKLESVSPALLAALTKQDFDAIKENLKGLKPMELDDVLYQEVDVLFPCAVQDVIHSDNVDRIRASCVVEGANNPCSEEARTRMFDKNIRLVPDFIANPGGIVAAYVEMLSEVSPKSGDPRENVEKAKTFTRERITANVRELMALVTDLSVEPAQAGRFIALRNIFEK